MENSPQNVGGYTDIFIVYTAPIITHISSMTQLQTTQCNTTQYVNSETTGALSCENKQDYQWLPWIMYIYLTEALTHTYVAVVIAVFHFTWMK